MGNTPPKRLSLNFIFKAVGAPRRRRFLVFRSKKKKFSRSMENGSRAKPRRGAVQQTTTSAPAKQRGVQNNSESNVALPPKPKR